MGEVLRRLGVARAVGAVGAHPPRRPVARRRPGASGRTPAGSRLLNTGSWVYQPHFLAGGAGRDSPYWPGSAVVVEAEGPPRLIRLLGDRSHAALRPPA